MNECDLDNSTRSAPFNRRNIVHQFNLIISSYAGVVEMASDGSFFPARRPQSESVPHFHQLQSQMGCRRALLITPRLPALYIPSFAFRRMSRCGPVEVGVQMWAYDPCSALKSRPLFDPV